MMYLVYMEYNDCKDKLNEIQKRYKEILEEKEQLFNATSIKPTRFRYGIRIRSKYNSVTNSFDDYLEAKEEKRIDERLSEIRSMIKDRSTLLKMKEQELKSSKCWDDILYVCFFVDNMPISKIKSKIPYGQSQIYRMLKKIKQEIYFFKDGKK